MKIVGEIENSSCIRSCIKKISKCHNFCNFGQIAKKSDSLYDYNTLYKVWMNRMKSGRGEKFLENSKIGNFTKCTEWSQTKFKQSGIKSTLHMSTVVPRVPNFHPFRPTISRFRDNIHILGFPIDSHVKISKCHKMFSTWPIVKKSDSLYSTVVANVLIKFGWHQMKTVGGAFWNFQPRVVLCWEKFQSVIKFLIFGRLPKKVIAYISPRLWYFVWSYDQNVMKTVEAVVFRKSWNQKLCKVHRMTPNQTQGIGHQKYSTYMHCSTPSPKFSSVSLYDQPFLRYSTFYLSHSLLC